MQILTIIPKIEVRELKNNFLVLLNSKVLDTWTELWMGMEHLLENEIITLEEATHCVKYFKSFVKKLNENGNLSLVDRNGVDLEIKVPGVALRLWKIGIQRELDVKGLFDPEVYWRIPEETETNYLVI